MRRTELLKGLKLMGRHAGSHRSKGSLTGGPRANKTYRMADKKIA